MCMRALVAVVMLLVASPAFALDGFPLNFRTWVHRSYEDGTTSTGCNPIASGTEQGWTIVDTQNASAPNRANCVNSYWDPYTGDTASSANQYLPAPATGVWTYTYEGVQRGAASVTDRAWYLGLCDATSAAAGVFSSGLAVGCTTFVGLYKPAGVDALRLVSGSALGAATLTGTGATVSTVLGTASTLTYNPGVTSYRVAIIHDNVTGFVRVFFNDRLVGTRLVAAGALVFDVSWQGVLGNSGHASNSISMVTAQLRNRKPGEP